MDAAHLRAEAAKCRSLAKGARDKMIAKNLLALAGEYEEEAERAEQELKVEPRMPLPE